MLDYQNHSTFSDGRGTIEQICRFAEERKLKEICITDHIILLDSYETTIEDIDLYFKSMEDAKANTRVTVRIGAEVDYFEEKEKEIERILDEYPFDYILGSTHFLGPENTALNDSRLYRNISQIKVYETYFAKWKKAVKSQLFDSMAHPDYIRRWAVPYYGQDLEFADYRNMISEACEFIADHDIGIDVNCSGYRHGLGSTYPSKDFLSLCKEMGAKIFVTSSDSHRPEDVGSYLERGMETLKITGIEEITSFSRRRPATRIVI